MSTQSAFHIEDRVEAAATPATLPALTGPHKPAPVRRFSRAAFASANAASRSVGTCASGVSGVTPRRTPVIASAGT